MPTGEDTVTFLNKLVKGVLCPKLKQNLSCRFHSSGAGVWGGVGKYLFRTARVAIIACSPFLT